MYWVCTYLHKQEYKHFILPKKKKVDPSFIRGLILLALYQNKIWVGGHRKKKKTFSQSHKRHKGHCFHRKRYIANTNLITFWQVVLTLTMRFLNYAENQMDMSGKATAKPWPKNSNSCGLVDFAEACLEILVMHFPSCWNKETADNWYHKKGLHYQFSRASS